MGEDSWLPSAHGRAAALASNVTLTRVWLRKEKVAERGCHAAKKETETHPQTSAHSLLLGTKRQPGCGCAPASPWCLLQPLPLGSVP